MRNKQTLQKRNKEILSQVSKMLAEKSSRGNRKYSIWYIYDVVGEQHDLESRTVKNIYESLSIDFPVNRVPTENSPAAL